MFCVNTWYIEVRICQVLSLNIRVAMLFIYLHEHRFGRRDKTNHKVRFNLNTGPEGRSWIVSSSRLSLKLQKCYIVSSHVGGVIQYITSGAMSAHPFCLVVLQISLMSLLNVH